jgi:hypothetical protein
MSGRLSRTDEDKYRASWFGGGLRTAAWWRSNRTSVTGRLQGADRVW